MSGCYVTDVTAIPYPGYGIVISFDCGNDNIYHITINTFPQCSCTDFVKMSAASLGKKGQWVNCKHMYYIFRFLCNLEYQTAPFIHALNFSYNEVMRIFVLAGVTLSEM